MNTCYIARKHHPSRGEVVEGPASFPHPMGQLLSLRRHPLPDFCCTGASSSIPCVHSTLTSYNAATSRGRHPQQPEWLPLTINPIHLVLCANALVRLPSSHCHPPNVACPCLLRQRVLTLGTDFSLPFQGVLSHAVAARGVGASMQRLWMFFFFTALGLIVHRHPGTSDLPIHHMRRPRAPTLTIDAGVGSASPQTSTTMNLALAPLTSRHITAAMALPRVSGFWAFSKQQYWSR